MSVLLQFHTHNLAARLILRRPHSDSARPLLQELHWLPVARRVDFKILALKYKAIHDETPGYLCELMRPYQQARALRSASSNNLEVKCTCTKAGGGSFAVAAASLWNTLPNFIKTCDTHQLQMSTKDTFLSHCVLAYIADEHCPLLIAI